MEPGPVIDIMQEGLRAGLFIALPPLLMALIVGLCVSIFQAVTSIQEQTLVFIPKILAASVALVFFMPWMVQMITDYATRVLELVATFGM